MGVSVVQEDRVSPAFAVGKLRLSAGRRRVNAISIINMIWICLFIDVPPTSSYYKIALCAYNVKGLRMEKLDRR
jgi:hypothetical protein